MLRLTSVSRREKLSTTCCVASSRSLWDAAQTGVPIGAFQFVPYELILIPGLIVLAALAGYIPALSAYRTDVSRALSATP